MTSAEEISNNRPSRPYSPTRTPTFWLLLVAVAVGSAATGALLAVLAVHAPRATLVSLPLVGGYLLLSLLVIRYLDPVGNRPWWLVLLALGWGGTGAVAVGGGAGLTLDNVLAQATSPTISAAWGAAIVAPTAEEVAKGAGVLLLLLAARPHLSTVFGGAVYGAIIGAGFAAVEDASYALSAADETLPDDVGEALRIVVLRVTLPGVIGHPFFTALVGAGVAYAVVRVDRPRGQRMAALAGAFAMAWLVHAAVNSPMAFAAAESFDRLPGFAPLAGYFLVVGVPALLAVRWLARLRRRELGWLTRGLTAPEPPMEDAPTADLPATAGPVFAVTTAAEAYLLTSRYARARAGRMAALAHGPAAGKAVRRLHRAQLAFLDLPPNTHPAGWSPDRQARAELAAARTRLYRLTGSAQSPIARSLIAEFPVTRPSWIRTPEWLARATVVLAVAGLAHWSVPLLGAIALSVYWARRRAVPRLLIPVGLAVAAAGYVWLTSALLVRLFPGQL